MHSSLQAADCRFIQCKHKKIVWTKDEYIIQYNIYSRWHKYWIQIYGTEMTKIQYKTWNETFEMLYWIIKYSLFEAIRICSRGAFAVRVHMLEHISHHVWVLFDSCFSLFYISFSSGLCIFPEFFQKLVHNAITCQWMFSLYDRIRM